MAFYSNRKGASGTVAPDHIEFTSTARQNASDEHASKADLEDAGTLVVTNTEVRKYDRSDDEAMKALANYEGPPLVLDDATSRKLLRKIDWHIMPILFLCWGLNYLDKVSISYASIMGLKEDLNLVGNQYSTLGSLFYIGELVWEFPTSRLLQYLPIAKYCAFCVIVWGALLAAFAGASNFAGAAAIRFLLGVFESASLPAFALIASIWYTKREHNQRTGIYISANGFGQIFGGLIAYGVAKRIADHPASIAGWRILFLGFGLFTVLVGIVFYYVIPDNQLNCRWMDERERLLAIERVKENEQGIGNRKYKWYQLREVFVDPHFWALFFYGILNDIPNGGLTNFFSQLIVSFGYSKLDALLFGIPGGAVVIIACWVNGWAGGRFHSRVLIACVPMGCAFLGCILIVALPISNSVGRLIGYYLTQAAPAANATVLSLISSNVAGYTKKTSVAALYLVSYCVGNIIGPYTFTPQAAPRYVSAEITILVCYGLCLFILLFIYGWYRRENSRKAKIRTSDGYVPLENAGWMDLTDREHIGFNYTL